MFMKKLKRKKGYSVSQIQLKKKPNANWDFQTLDSTKKTISSQKFYLSSKRVGKSGARKESIQVPLLPTTNINKNSGSILEALNASINNKYKLRLKSNQNTNTPSNKTIVPKIEFQK
mmetsp:Transcript_32818/g.29109  ORF Transcript_32818/g.29109 Transcript_32818/m.29109 type:complete len:117 (+) Transcript_32818:252-602(+)